MSFSVIERCTFSSKPWTHIRTVEKVCCSNLQCLTIQLKYSHFHINRETAKPNVFSGELFGQWLTTLFIGWLLSIQICLFPFCIDKTQVKKFDTWWLITWMISSDLGHALPFLSNDVSHNAVESRIQYFLLCKNTNIGKLVFMLCNKILSTTNFRFVCQTINVIKLTEL